MAGLLLIFTYCHNRFHGADDFNEIVCRDKIVLAKAEGFVYFFGHAGLDKGGINAIFYQNRVYWGSRFGVIGLHWEIQRRADPQEGRLRQEH